MINFYNTDLNKLVALTLPVLLRKLGTVNWLLALIQPFKDLHKQFMVYRYSALYKIQHTPQVYSMENVFNDAFDAALKRIFIRDGVYISPVYFYEPAEVKPVHFFEDIPGVNFFEPEELLNSEVDFEVVLPIDINLSESELTLLNSLIIFYKLPDKTYKISYE